MQIPIPLPSRAVVNILLHFLNYIPLHPPISSPVNLTCDT